MILRLLNTKSNNVVSAAAIIAVLSLLSRMVGLVRDRILAGTFGVGPVLDAYYAAFKIPDFLFGLIVVGSLSASFIPIFTAYYRKKRDRDRAWAFTNNVLHVVLAVLGAAALLTAIFAVPVAKLVAPGFDPAGQRMVAEFMRIMLVAQVLLGGSIVFGSALQGMKRFFLYALSPIFYNAGIIAGAVWFVDHVGPVGLAWGVVFGAFLHLLLQFIGVRMAGYRYRPHVRLRDADMREMLRLTGPRMFGVAMAQVNLVLFSVIATTLVAGSVTMFQFAYNIQFFPIGIFAISYAIAAFPTFTQCWEDGDTKAFIDTFSNTTRQVLFLIIPMGVIFFLLRNEIVDVVVGAGRFNADAIAQTADTLGFFALSFGFQALVYISVRAFFALHDTVTPLIAAVSATAIGVVSAWWLSHAFGVIGLGAAYSLGVVFQILFLWIPLRRRLGQLDEAHIVRALLLIATGAVLAGLTTWLLRSVSAPFIPSETAIGVFLRGVLAGGGGLLVYVVTAFLLKSEELLAVVGGLRRRLFARFQPSEPISPES